MTSTHLSPNTLEQLQQLIGAQLLRIYVEGGSIEKGDHMMLDGLGMISIVFAKGTQKYKWRLQFRAATAGEFYSEFYHWETPPSMKERYNPATGEVNYDQVLEENLKKYPLAINIAPKDNEDFQLANQIQSIKIYHAVGAFDSGESYDCVAIIGMTTATGRSIFIEADDPEHSFYMYFDEPKTIHHRLAELHDDPGSTFGEHRYRLRHALTR